MGPPSRQCARSTPSPIPDPQAQRGPRDAGTTQLVHLGGARGLDSCPAPCRSQKIRETGGAIPALCGLDRSQWADTQIRAESRAWGKLLPCPTVWHH